MPSCAASPPRPIHPWPLRVIPTKLGLKTPELVMRMGVGNVYTGGYWEEQGYNRFSGS